ncbi:adenylosuccinate synthase [Candidatus Cryosericum septentrionale]|jgi:adenylosuccinate synthase|uniref:Adenylosuccinate synthetase n=1 Tax=Candidatus Cryosericum septentrionale TaxID=2290913 RepID=A0A398DLB8_9BACT|nr:adenylosuccinate synthase [Candidatus Cryosericum septentrionale]RIE16486.1 adenylosuccinate synthase [Candidatus Cryosericum septentrionale]
MKRVAVVGAQWGDEGKGKVVNYFAKDFEWIVRFAGGANAGHTIYVGDKKYINHLLPCILPDGTGRGFLGAGMVVDLEQLVAEVEVLAKDFPGVGTKFAVDPEVFLVLPWHKQQDQLLEAMRAEPIGTTGRGIGPAYTDKASREGIKLCHLFDEKMLTERLENSWVIKQNLYRGQFSMPPAELAGLLMRQRDRLLELGVQVTGAVDMAHIFRSTSVLFEGAQGVLLDLDFGTYPFVTSGSCMAHGVSSVGFSTFELDDVAGVLKAYTTRVGEGPFPSEDDTDVAQGIRERGKEYGATTGRPRRIGWLDLPALRYAAIRSGLTSLVITKADVLNGLKTVRVCTSYRIGGVVRDVPSTSHDFFVAEPVYEELPGWRTTDDVNFLKYMTFIEEQVSVPITYISYGPHTDEMETKSRLIMNI